METIKLTYQDDRFEEYSCAVYYFQKYIYCLILKDERITSIIWKMEDPARNEKLCAEMMRKIIYLTSL